MDTSANQFPESEVHDRADVIASEVKARTRTERPVICVYIRN